jgi:hypothetical protein
VYVYLYYFYLHYFYLLPGTVTRQKPSFGRLGRAQRSLAGVIEPSFKRPMGKNRFLAIF